MAHPSTGPIVPLRDAPGNEGGLLSETPSVLSEYDVDYLYDVYHISRESFRLFAPSPDVRMSDLIPAEDTIIVFKEQLKAGLRFLIDSFFCGCP